MTGVQHRDSSVNLISKTSYMTDAAPLTTHEIARPLAEEDLKMKEFITPDDVLRLNKITKGVCFYFIAQQGLFIFFRFFMQCGGQYLRH